MSGFELPVIIKVGVDEIDMLSFARRKQSGHNLLEVILATLVFTTVMVPLAMVFQYISTATAQTRTKLMGQYLCKGLMEKCLAAKYYNVLELESDIHGGPVTYDPVAMTFRKDGAIIEHLFYPEVDIENAVGPWIGGSVQGRIVRVRVSWEVKNRRDAANRPYVEYTTYIGQNS